MDMKYDFSVLCLQLYNWVKVNAQPVYPPSRVLVDQKDIASTAAPPEDFTILMSRNPLPVNQTHAHTHTHTHMHTQTHMYTQTQGHRNIHTYELSA